MSKFTRLRRRQRRPGPKVQSKSKWQRSRIQRHWISGVIL